LRHLARRLHHRVGLLREIRSAFLERLGDYRPGLLEAVKPLGLSLLAVELSNERQCTLATSLSLRLAHRSVRDEYSRRAV
jgi:hypothetical protein